MSPKSVMASPIYTIDQLPQSPLGTPEQVASGADQAHGPKQLAVEGSGAREFVRRRQAGLFAPCSLRALSARFVVQVLAECGGNKRQACRLLGIHYWTLTGYLEDAQLLTEGRELTGQAALVAIGAEFSRLLQERADQAAGRQTRTGRA